MDALIDDLLTLARKGRTVGETESVDLARVAEEAWRTVDTPAATLEVGDVGTVEADDDRVRELFENLFRNAQEHATAMDEWRDTAAGTTPSGDDAGTDGTPAVTVRVDAHDDGFFVADDGPGIPPAEREGVFQHGYTTSEDGTGFGLSIVQRIAEAHDWAVSVTESRTGGARFEIDT